MKRNLFILLTFSALISFGQAQNVTIKDFKLNFKTVFIDNEDGSPIKQVELFRGNSKLLEHIISKSEGDCNSESIELGAFVIKDTTITFYSYWASAGDAPVSPFGVRKQIYSVGKDGNLSLTKAELYIETSRQSWKENKGMNYLFSSPKNESERKQLKEYIKDVEETYNGKFVLGATKNLLFAEVRAKLKRQIQAATKNWRKYYADKLGGYKI